MTAPEPFEFSAASLPGATVLSFSGVERVSAPFRFDVELEIGGGTPREDLKRLVGGRATLSFTTAAGVARTVHGFVSRVAQGRGGEAASARLRVRLEPRLRLLRHTKRSRVFQDMTAKQIVDAVLDGGRVPHTWRTAPEGAPREHGVQFQETDLDFFHRLLAEEGWFYFFEHPNGEGGERVVLASRAEDYQPIAGPANLRISAQQGMVGEEDLEHLELVRSIRSGGALLRAHDYRRPSYDMRGEAARAVEADLDEKDFVVYEHVHDPEDGDLDGDRAARRLDGVRADALMVRGRSSCRRLMPGAWFDVEEHTLGELDARFVVSSVRHEGRRGVATEGGPVYWNTFRAAPATVPLRPRPPGPRPFRPNETATVVGPAGKEIHTDALGRVKVKFHWDLDGRSDDTRSCWIRTMQSWSGPSWGAQFVPRVGMEVVVTFVQGDVDRPLVIGTVYNGAAPFPFPLPASATQSGWRTRSTPGGDGSNELRFEDAAGKEKVFLHAERDLEDVIGHDHYSTVTHHRTQHVGGDCYLAVNGNSIETVQKSQAVTIQEDMILHVVGRQVIQVDGATGGGADDSDDGEAGAPAAEAARQEAPGSASAPRDDGTASTQLSRARVLWAAERVPDDRYESARAQVDAVDAFAGELSSLCSKALEGLSAADAVSRSAAGEALAALGDRLAAAVLDTMSKREGPHPAVSEAAIEALRSLHSGTVRARAALATGPEGAAELRGVIRGGGGGGGTGGAPGSGNCPDIPAPPKPTPKPKDSGTIKIKGGYTIDSPDGLTLKGQGANLTMKGGKLSGDGTEVVIEAGAKLKLVCGGSVIEMLPGAININTSGVIKLWAGMILLN